MAILVSFVIAAGAIAMHSFIAYGEEVRIQKEKERTAKHYEKRAR